MTEAEQKAFSEEFRSRTGTRPTDKGAAQRLREFMRIFTPEGAMAVQFERQAENKALYNSLQMSSVTPVIAPHRFDFEDTASSTTSSRRDQKTTTAPTPPQRPAVLGDSTEFEDF